MMRWVPAAVVVLLLCAPSRADESARMFLDGIRLYKEGQYTASVETFQKLADDGLQSGMLYYNLGNAYLKNGNLGRAILWYERALKLIPNDPDLRFNHDYALTLTRDENADASLPLTRILFFWRYLLTEKAVQWLAVGFNFLFWGLLTVRLWRRRRGLTTALSIACLLAGVFTATAGFNYFQPAFFKEGVVLSGEIPVKSGLTTDSTTLFVLHSGTKIMIRAEKGGYYKIFFSEGKLGWVPKTDIGVI